MGSPISTDELWSAARAKINSAILDDASMSWFDAMTTAITPQGSQRLNKLVYDLKQAGVYSKLTGLWLPVAESAQAARVNAVSPSQIGTESGSPTFTKNRGYAVSSANYVNSGVAISSLFTQDSAMLGVYVLTGSQSSNGIVGNAANTTNRITLRTSLDQLSARVNASSGVVCDAGVYDARGLTVVQRTSASTVQFYKNGEKWGSDASSASTGLAVDNLLFGFASTSDAKTLGAVIAGQPLSATEHAALNVALRTYMASVGAYYSAWPAQKGLSKVASIQTPDIAGASATGKGFTITGLAYVASSGRLLAGDDGRYGQEDGTFDSSNWRPKFHLMTTAGALVSSIGIYALDGGASTLQGVAVDGSGNYWGARTARNKVIKVSAAGALLADLDFSADGGPNGLAIDTLRGLAYVSGANSTSLIYAYRLSDWALTGAIQLPTDMGTEPIDHLSHYPDGDILYITKGDNGVNGRVYGYSLAAGAALTLWRPLSSNAIEAALRVGSTIYLANDGWFHKNAGVAVGVNEIQTYSVP